MSTTRVSYYTINSFGRILQDYHRDHCFSAMSYDPIDKDADRLIVYHATLDCIYTEEEVKRWVEDVSEMGFSIEYLGIDFHHSLPSYRFLLNFSDYRYKVHLTSALILLRYLFEDYIEVMPKHYFGLVEAAPELDKFKLMQMVHIYLINEPYANTNHTLRRGAAFHLKSKESVWKRIEEEGTLTKDYMDSNRCSVSRCWTSEIILGFRYSIISKSFDYSKLINFYKNNKLI